MYLEKSVKCLILWSGEEVPIWLFDINWNYSIMSFYIDGKYLNACNSLNKIKLTPF